MAPPASNAIIPLHHRTAFTDRNENTKKLPKRKPSKRNRAHDDGPKPEHIDNDFISASMGTPIDTLLVKSVNKKRNKVRTTTSNFPHETTRTPLVPA